MPATTASRTWCGRRWNSATPIVTAMTTWTAKPAAEPTQTNRGRPRVDMTRDANIVLSGSSPMKMIGKTAKTTAKSTGPFLSPPNVACPGWLPRSAAGRAQPARPLAGVIQERLSRHGEDRLVVALAPQVEQLQGDGVTAVAHRSRAVEDGVDDGGCGLGGVDDTGV